MNADVALALASVPEPARPAVNALWALDHALGRVVATVREPMICRVRLAWWREALARLDREPPRGAPARSHRGPRPRGAVRGGLEREVLPRGVSGAERAEMEPGWALLPGDQPITADDLNAYARARGGLLFSYSARLLGAEGYVASAG